MAGYKLIKGGYVYPSRLHADILVLDDHIESVGDNLTAPQGTQTIDASGCIVIPGLVEAHCHLDKTLWSGPWLEDRSASTIAERIALKEKNKVYGLPNAKYAAALLRTMVSYGTTHVRTHTDVDPEIGIRGIQMISEVAEAARGEVTVEQVAFPQSGIARAPGTLELLREAAKQQGVVAIGGVDPAGVDREPHVQLRGIFDVAANAGLRVDIHLHDPGTLGAWEMELIAEYTKTFQMEGRVTISHAFALGTVSSDHQRRLAELLAARRISVITAVPYDRALLPTDLLIHTGVELGLGNDNIDDLWSAYGTGDMLERAWLLAYRSEWRKDSHINTALDIATTGNARVLQLQGYGVTAGCQADLVIIKARTPGELMVRRPGERLVIKAGAAVRGQQ